MPQKQRSPQTVIKIRVNGEDLEVNESMTLKQLLDQFNIVPEQVAVEHNETVLKRTEFSAIELRANDKIEIIHFMGGGES